MQASDLALLHGRPDVPEVLDVVQPLLRVGGMLRHPAQQALHAVDAASELHEVGRQAPDVSGEAFIPDSLACALLLQMEHLRCGKWQGAAALQESLLGAAQHHGEAKVCEAKAVPSIGDYKVRGLQVPVADPRSVQVRHGGRLMPAEALHDLRGQGGAAGALHRLDCVYVEVHFACVVHDQHNVGLRVEGPMRPNDIRMSS
mmetsp:Transcript_111085/g.309351  ORF Transcript_111085/g.309351 Transcript_111085/m.309351 type:complete len:201 (+) Transcript_111085:340-942(+)